VAEIKPKLPWGTHIILHSRLIKHLVSGLLDTQHTTNVCKDSYNYYFDFCIARTVIIIILIFVLQGQLQFILWFLGCKESYNSDCDFWVARTVTIHILIFVLLGQLQLLFSFLCCKGSYNYYFHFCVERAVTIHIVMRPSRCVI